MLAAGDGRLLTLEADDSVRLIDPVDGEGALSRGTPSA